MGVRILGQVAVEGYKQLFVPSDFTADVLTITQATHGKTNPTYYCWDSDNNEEVIDVQINDSTGDVTIDASSTGGAFTGYIHIT